MNSTAPLVSLLTPVYNGARYLSECIESVLAQTYPHWRYTIVDNCSTDESAAIALKYATKDSRIRVVSNERFLRMLENHNHTARQLDPESRYCKFLFGDDWLYPSCLEEMVHAAEQDRSIGMVGAYTTNGRAVLWQAPPYPCKRVSGWELCRSMLLGGPWVLGTMTSLLVRSDLIRKRAFLFDERTLHGDTAAYFDILQESDYAYVHQVLSFSRPPEGSAGSFADSFDSIILGVVLVFLKYGPIFLSNSEYQQKSKELRWRYHRVLAHNVLRMRSKQFWDYHRQALAAFGGGVEPGLIAACLLSELIGHVAHPFQSLEHAQSWWSRALGRTSSASRYVEVERLP